MIVRTLGTRTHVHTHIHIHVHTGHTHRSGNKSDLVYVEGRVQNISGIALFILHYY